MTFYSHSVIPQTFIPECRGVLVRLGYVDIKYFFIATVNEYNNLYCRLWLSQAWLLSWYHKNDWCRSEDTNHEKTLTLNINWLWKIWAKRKMFTCQQNVHTRKSSSINDVIWEIKLIKQFIYIFTYYLFIYTGWYVYDKAFDDTKIVWHREKIQIQKVFFISYVLSG